MSAPAPISLETAFQRLLTLGLAHLDCEPSLPMRAKMLRAAAVHLPDEIRAQCEVTASAIDLAESAQFELRGLLF